MDKNSRRRFIRWGIISGNVALLLVIGVFIVSNRGASQTIRQSTVGGATGTASSVRSPLDQLSSAQIALQAAQMTKLPETVAVRNQADTENALLAVVPSDSSIVAKPQIVSTAQKSRADIVHYVSKAGDTVTSIAAQFKVSANSIKWSNNLTSDTVAPGSNILVPPAEGIVYQVKAGDTVDTVTTKFQANKSLFITVNDAESGNLAVGDYVWVPNGQIQAVQITSPRFSVSGFAFGGTDPVYAGNGYDYGYCTWYVANKRIEIGRPIPSNLGNASTWKVLAQKAGLPTGPTPQVGAVAWQVPYDYFGHVAYVEAVYPDGSFLVSEMNVVRWAVKSTRVITPDQLSSYYFIY